MKQQKKFFKKSGEKGKDRKETKDLAAQWINTVKQTSFSKLISSIRFKLIASFIIPIAFIIILGVVSFLVAATGIRNNYRESSAQTLEMTGKYLEFGLDSIEDSAIQYSVDKTFTKYFSGLYDTNVIEKSNAIAAISNTVSAKQVTDTFVGDIYLISDKVKSITSRYNSGENLYSGITESDTGQLLKSNNLKAMWIGYDDQVDSLLGADTNKYALRLMRSMQSANGYIIIDVSTDAVRNVLADLELSESGYLAMITEDGKEIMSEEGEEPMFYETKFYKKAFESEEESGSEFVNYKKKNYLFLYSKIENTGAMLCALIPKEVITRQADHIKLVTVVIAMIACVTAIATGVVMSNGMDKVIKGIISGLKKASEGDLTVEFTTSRTDEFRILINEIQNTFGNMKQLIQKASLSGMELKESSSNVSDTSAEFLKSSKDITSSIQEIEQGIMQQAKDAEECLQYMDNLSKKIIVVGENTKEISQLADNTKVSINEGTDCTNELNYQTKSTIDITTNIINEIEKLAEKSLSINNISDVISKIAGSTNLLSLNASIEAARAGEAGRGFAVVASEIRNLAEQSKHSADEIKHIINSIQEDIGNVLKTAQASGEVLQAQEGAVKNTTDSYQNINENVEKLVQRLANITENVGNIEEARVSTLGAIENISAVLEEIAASSNTVNQTSNEQLVSVETLNQSAKILNDNAELLLEAIQRFTI
ncbi:MAG: methyl-accepting chemotaxis protein [Lachnospiraceae bacterium]|jgi:methyl-accepting chemotaxis protein|nr:methyl-accepting chemotaxis protein [Lachnospiraceae bacterium]